MKKGEVRRAIPGILIIVCFISRRTWFFRYLGCLEVFLSKMKKYERDAQTK